MIDLRDFSLKDHTTFGIDARCRRFIEFSSVDELQSILPTLTAADAPLLILGGGSNLLLTRDYPSTVLHSAICPPPEVVRHGDEVMVRAGSGMLWDDLVAFCIAHEAYATENLSLIPGTVGASAVQNIGAYGVEAKDIIHEVECVEIATGAIRRFNNADCQYSYRHSRFKSEWRGRFVVTHVTYRLSATFRPNLDYGNIREALHERGIDSPTASQLREVIIAIREAKLPDPKVQGNAGSFFMNPIVPVEQYESLLTQYPDLPHYPIDSQRVKIPAGWLIDRCGWKGKSMGRTGVHDRQALVLVNRGGATGQEIVALCDAIRRDVHSRFGIEIIPEVNIL